MSKVETPAKIFHTIRRGNKPWLDINNPMHKAIIATLENMEQADLLDGGSKLYYRDFVVDKYMTPAQQTRLNSYTTIQPFTNSLAEIQKQVEQALEGTSATYEYVGRNPFTRTGRTRFQIGMNRMPKVIAPGNPYEAESLARSLYKRNVSETAPLFVYNPDGFWDPLLSVFADNIQSSQHIHICKTLPELRAAVNEYGNVSYLGTPPVRSKERGAFKIESATPRLFQGSNNAEKRKQIALSAIHNNTAFRIHHIGDQTLNFINNEEITATGSGNAAGKMMDAIAHYKGSRMRRTMEGHVPEDTYCIVSDITMECDDERISHHPQILKKYGHVMKPGQKFPGSEMANVEKTTNIDTVMADIHKAYDDLGVPAHERKLSIQTVNYLFPLDQNLPANATERDIKYVVVSAKQEYLLRRTPLPLNRYGNETYAYVTLASEPNTSLREYFETTGTLHPQSHLAKAWQTLEHVIDMPKRDVAAPYLSKPHLANPARVVTSAHYTGEWTGNAADHFTRDALQNFESAGYVFADTWQGGQGILELEKFRQNNDAFVILPVEYKNENNDETILQNKMNHLAFAISHWVDRELSDPYVRGRPLINYDKDFARMFAVSYRLGLNNLPADKGATMANSGENLASMLDASWQPYEYNRDPHLPYWDEDPIIPEFTKEHVVALLGSAKSFHREKLEGSARLACLFHEAGWAVSDGHGGEGDMGAFAYGAILASKTTKDVERFGVTTPLTAIEKRPVCLDGTIHEKRYATTRDIYRRMHHGILREGVFFANSRAGGAGTLQELHLFSQKIIEGRDAINVIDSSPIKVRNHGIKPFAGYSRLFTDWEKSRMNLVEAASVEEMFERTIDFANERKLRHANPVRKLRA